MAKEIRLSIDGPREYVAGNSVCVSGGDTGSNWWSGARRGNRPGLLGNRSTAGSYGGRWPIAATFGRLVAGRYFLLSRDVLFLQNADVKSGQSFGFHYPCRLRRNAEFAHASK